MSPKPDLFLHEELLLLALRDGKGTIAGSFYQQAMAGGILSELLLGERIRIREGKKALAAWER